MMERKQAPFRIIESRNSQLIVSTPNFQRLVIHQLELTQNQLPQYLNLIKFTTHTQNVLLPIMHHTILQQSNQSDLINQDKYCNKNKRLRIITEQYQFTLQDMTKRKGKFDEEQLENTMEQVLRILKQVYDKGLEYGMLDSTTVCFYKQQVVLGFGKQKNRINGESYLQHDLRSLGEMILDLCIEQKGTTEQLLKLAQLKYQFSLKFLNKIKILVDKNSRNRIKIWPNFDKSFKQGTKHNPNEINIPNNKKQNALSESNNYEGIESSFTDKITKLNQMVDEYLKRSKKVIQRSQNNRTRIAR